MKKNEKNEKKNKMKNMKQKLKNWKQKFPEKSKIYLIEVHSTARFSTVWNELCLTVL